MLGKRTYQARVIGLMIRKEPNEAYEILEPIPMTGHPDHVCKSVQLGSTLFMNYALASFNLLFIAIVLSPILNTMKTHLSFITNINKTLYNTKAICSRFCERW